MRNHLRTIGVAMTAFALTVGLLSGGALSAPAAAAQVTLDPTIRVGLYYGDNSLPSANLENSMGSGYFFGIYDSELNFLSLAETPERKITMNASNASPGRYHLQLNTPFEDGESAALAAESYGGYICYIGGSYWVRTGVYPSFEAAAAMASPAPAEGDESLTTAFLPAEDSISTVTVTITGTANILFQFDNGGSEPFAVFPNGNGEQPSTWFKGFKYYGGFQYRGRDGAALSVINVVTLEDYVKGVVTVEMSPSWPLEALKAQAVCARNYAYRRLSNSTHATQGFDICNTVHCQAYSGMKAATATSDEAVESTYGQYAYYKNDLADTVYYASNGGGSENSENVWTSAVPYLRGVVDPYEPLVDSRIPKYHWTVTYTKSELSALMNSKGYSNSGNVSVHVSKTSPTGNVIEVVLTDLDSGRTWTKRKEEVRTFFGLRSMRYTISADGASGGSSVLVNGTSVSSSGLYALDADGNITSINPNDVYVITADGVEQLNGGGAKPSAAQVFTFDGVGSGHHVGMSQWGAYSMAQQGYTYQDILKFYYTGIEIKTP